MTFNMARFDFASVQLVVLCAETGSLSAAARRAHCSVSAGSQRVSAVERALGRKLFLRDHKGMRITQDGEVFVQHALQILALLEFVRIRLAPVSSARHVS